MEAARKLKERLDLDTAFSKYQASGDENDLETVVEAGKALVNHFVNVYTPAGYKKEDSLQAGMEGLLKAASRYNADKGASFATFAAYCIIGEVRHYMRKEASYYRPGCLAGLQGKVDQFIEEEVKKTGEFPATAAIADALNVKEKGVVQVLRAGLVSLDELELSEIQCQKYESFRLPIEDKLLLQQAIARLNTVQQRVVYLLFFRDMTQNEAADRLGITQRKVSRHLHRSLKNMADFMQENV